MLELHSTDRVTVAGLPGNGKTVFAKYLAAMAYPNVLVYDPLGQFRAYKTVTLADMERAPKTFMRKGNRYVPQSDSVEEFDRVCAVLRKCPDIFFVVEECELYLSVRRPITPDAYALVNRGRNWGVGVAAVTRRIEELSKSYFGLCKHVYFFRCGLRSDKYIAEMVGQEVTDTIKALPPFHFIDYDVMTGAYVTATLDLGELN